MTIHLEISKKNKDKILRLLNWLKETGLIKSFNYDKSSKGNTNVDENKSTFNIHDYCGVIKLKESPLEIQKRMRDEWT